jgi:hypothetical protein
MGIFSSKKKPECDTDSDCDSDEECNSSDECEDISCDDGYQLNSKSKECELIPCTAVQQRNAVSNKCELIPCTVKQQRNAVSNKCELIPCATGYQRNDTSKECELIPCATGYTRGSSSNDCNTEASYWNKPDGWYDSTNSVVTDDWKTKSFGKNYNIKCPDKSYIDTIYHNTGSHVDNMGFKCTDGSKHYMKRVAFDPNDTDDFSTGITNIPNYRMYNTGPGVRTLFKPVANHDVLTNSPFTCPSGTKLTGMRGEYNNYMGNVEFRCS